MNKELPDIELIRKYLSGELSPATMQELEAKALDDAFLHDTLEGFGKEGIDKNDLEKLSKRLDDRIKKKKGKIITINWGLKQWGIAASLIIGISVLSIYLNQTPENKTIAVSELQKQEGLPQNVKVKIDSDKTEENTTKLLDKSPALGNHEMTKIASVKSYSPADEISVEPVTDALNPDTVDIGDLKITRISTMPKERISKTLENKKVDFNTVSTNVEKSIVIKGKVMDITSGYPLPGVQLRDLSNGNSTISDGKGNFILLGKNKDKIEAKYIGFVTEELAAEKEDTLKIDLKPDEKAISKVVSLDDGNQNNNTLAGPDGGWHTFRKYLDYRAHLSNQEKGRVVLQFMIMATGELTDFKILKTFSPVASGLALKLIKDYHAWHGAENGVPQKARVIVRFK